MVPSFDKNVTAAFVKRKFYTTVSSTVSQYKNLFLQQEILNTLHQIITLMCNSMSFVLNATFIRKLYFLELHCLQTFSLIHCYTHFSWIFFYDSFVLNISDGYCISKLFWLWIFFFNVFNISGFPKCEHMFHPETYCTTCQKFINLIWFRKFLR